MAELLESCQKARLIFMKRDASRFTHTDNRDDIR